MPLGFGRRSGVAVVEIHGVIGNHVRVPAYSRIFESVAKNKKLRAMLLDIDSPGGSATGSEVLYRGIQRVAEEKPVYAYVSGLGASGGYYLACAANRVYALPTALIGSIGVIYLRPVLEQLLSKVGVEFSVFKSGEFKDMTGFWRSPTESESEKFQELINEIFDNFVNVVATGRSLEEEKVREIATGEVLTAQRGLGLGLVDQIGDFTDALNAVAEAGDAKPAPKWLRPTRSLGQRIFGRSGAAYNPGGQALTEGLERLMAGGIYYLEPGHLTGGNYD
ncbi:MAG: signal peptide peptidase SppA [SAR202 cluster bacterium]|nr:signal peptide peptidase SppA [SAR202 cluster bacterium]|tara:strand:+ start:592 stop:1425 length:834 start_codon:yes stop_codon:yes gene_type:complete